ncbi:hypothetical protein AB0X98_01045 [Rothia koreensis]|uniref:hypothetical protein n=1 Tax=Rothia koreensis TaxID=592378 RepID=UPI003F2060E9
MELIDHIILNDAADHYGILSIKIIQQPTDPERLDYGYERDQYDRVAKHTRDFLNYHHLGLFENDLDTITGKNVEFRDGTCCFYVTIKNTDSYVIDPDSHACTRK